MTALTAEVFQLAGRIAPQCALTATIIISDRGCADLVSKSRAPGLSQGKPADVGTPAGQQVQVSSFSAAVLDTQLCIALRLMTGYRLNTQAKDASSLPVRISSTEPRPRDGRYCRGGGTAMKAMMLTAAVAAITIVGFIRRCISPSASAI
jgi:hypothetical protein